LFVAPPAGATFPGSNGRIAYRNVDSIDSIKPGGAGFVGLVSFPGGTAEFPRYSPDGKFIVFDANNPLEPNSSSDIYRMTSTGGFVTQLTSDASSIGDWGPSFGPKGKQIAFISNRTGGADDVWKMNSNGSNPLQVTSGMHASDTSWSPDGKWILFDSAASGNSEVYKIHPDGTGQKVLTHAPFIATGGDWSPDGSQITFSGTKTLGLPQVWVANQDGSHRHVLTHLASAGAYDPVWSPDGNWIAFDSANSGSFEIMKVKSGGGGQTTLTTGAGNVEAGWQPV
jgi:TolB protein